MVGEARRWILQLSDGFQSTTTSRFFTRDCWVDALPFIEIENLGGGGDGWKKENEFIMSILSLKCPRDIQAVLSQRQIYGSVTKKQLGSHEHIRGNLSH